MNQIDHKQFSTYYEQKKTHQKLLFILIQIIQFTKLTYYILLNQTDKLQ